MKVLSSQDLIQSQILTGVTVSWGHLQATLRIDPPPPRVHAECHHIQLTRQANMCPSTHATVCADSFIIKLPQKGNICHNLPLEFIINSVLIHRMSSKSFFQANVSFLPLLLDKQFVIYAYEHWGQHGVKGFYPGQFET